MAFTEYEKEQLRKALLKETRCCAVTLGMKKTSVDQLTRAVGIAKGSFYKFYESKEMLFFAVLEGIHTELYGVADLALNKNVGLPAAERAAQAVLAVCKRLSDTGDMIFIENDAKLLLQRLPEDVKNVHYHDDETHIRQLLEKYDLVLKRETSLAAATVRELILTVSRKEQIGELYPQLLETLVHGACRELFE
uniref:TetR/AcrR family transcriptional regulator n=1 Tax=Ndongobacter massiliensis TaxID=1871025 RepID=UPI0009313F86|nr:TetR/AcrR family transcriptional regulator [Ndongobacter massiliensis]